MSVCCRYRAEKKNSVSEKKTNRRSGLRQLRSDHQPEEWSVEEELEDERGGDLVGHVGHAHVKEGQLGFDDVTDQHLQLRLIVGALDTLLQFCHHSEVIDKAFKISAPKRHKS